MSIYMILITVILRGTVQLLQFHFKQFKDADKVLAGFSATDDMVKIHDDYNSKAIICKTEIAGIFLTDLSAEMDAHEIVDLAKTKKDLRVRKRQMEDPAMRLMLPQ